MSSAAPLLLEAYCCAADLGRDPWDFAVEIASLYSAGLTNSGLRWLLCKGYVRHAREVPAPAGRAGAFSSIGELALAPGTCFVLTEAGVAFVQGIPEVPLVAPGMQPPCARTNKDLVPVWDSIRQELRLGNQVVKRFKVPAPNQEVVLAAFEEERCPTRIDDPLPPLHGLEPKRRLHETITSLNRNQKHALVSFPGDGSGEGVRWGLVVGGDRLAHSD